MFITTTDYLKKITDALENVIAPEIEDDFIRGQLYAAIFLIDQMLDRIDYKPELIMEEIEMCCETIRNIVEGVDERTRNAPDELKTFLREIDRNGYSKTLEFRNQCDEMLSAAIDFFYANRDKLNEAEVRQIHRLIVDYFHRIALRDLGMMKPSTSGKLMETGSQT